MNSTWLHLGRAHCTIHWLCMYLITKVNFIFMQMNLSARPSLYNNKWYCNNFYYRLDSTCFRWALIHSTGLSIFANLTFIVVGVCCSQLQHKIQYYFSVAVLRAVCARPFSLSYCILLAHAVAHNVLDKHNHIFNKKNCFCFRVHFSVCASRLVECRIII